MWRSADYQILPTDPIWFSRYPARYGLLCVSQAWDADCKLSCTHIRCQLKYRTSSRRCLAGEVLVVEAVEEVPLEVAGVRLVEAVLQVVMVVEHSESSLSYSRNE